MQDPVTSQMSLDSAAEQLLPKLLQETIEEGIRARANRFHEEYKTFPSTCIMQLVSHFGYQHRVPVDLIKICSDLNVRLEQLKALGLQTGYLGEYASLAAASTMAAATAEIEALRRAISCCLGP